MGGVLRPFFGVVFEPRQEMPMSNAWKNSAVRRSIIDAVHDVVRCLPDLLLYDILFKIIGFVLLTPGAAWLARRVIAQSGGAAIGNFDIARFLLTPFGLVGAATLIAVFLAISFMELAGLMVIGFGAAKNRRLTYLDALKFVAGRAARVLAASAWILLVVALAALPFVAAVLGIALWLISDHDINFYLQNRPPEFQLALVLGAVIASVVLALGVFLYVAVSFVLPGVLFRDQTVRQALLQSRTLLKGRFRRVAAALALCLLVWVVVSLIANAAVYTLGSVVVAGTAERIGLLLIVLGILTALNVLIATAVTFVGTSVQAVLIVRLYRDACREESIELIPLGDGEPELGARTQWTIPRKTPLAVAAVVLVIAAATAYGLIEGQSFEDRVEITAHRGSSLDAPENTLAAIEQAIQDGATYVEFDVQITSDGVLVVAHDADLMRVGNRPMVISESKYEDLRDIDVGSSFDSKFADQRVPTLDEVIDLAKGRIKLLVELKSYGADKERLIDAVIRTLEERDVADDSVIMSLKYDEVQKIEERHPQFVTGFVSSVALGDIAELDVDFLAVSAAQVDDLLIGSAHAAGKEVYVWTIDDPTEMSAMIDRGVDNIITNVPATMVEVLEERSQLTDAQRVLLRFRNLYVP